MQYVFAKEKISQGIPMARKAWNTPCRLIRTAEESDYDYINYHPLTGIFVDDCKERVCDCAIGIYRPTPEDLVADDWEEVKNKN